MKKSLTLPTSELVKTACDEFDRENAEVEGALTELFRQYPENTDARHVLLKVAALNALYSTQIRVYTKTIPNILDVARHISRNGAYIDSALAAGALEVVDFIARMTVPGKKKHIKFSFATKYCNWHRPSSYAICDARVDAYIACLRHDAHFAKFFGTGEEHWRYPRLHEFMTIFRAEHGLGAFTFKEIDKFLWKYGNFRDPGGE